MKLPYILIFDIDIIIGDISLIINEYDILNIIHKNCKLENIINKCINKMNIEEELENGLLRPYFKEFVNFIINKYKYVEFYIYSQKYSNKFINNGIIRDIEKVSNINFNNPYLFTTTTFDDTINLIISNLSLKYPLLKKSKNKSYIIKNQIIFFSNFLNENLKNIQVLTPLYEYNIYYNIIKKIIYKYKIPKKIFNNKEILNYCDINNIPIYNKNGTQEQQDKQTQLILELYLLNSYKIYNNEIKDTYFNDLILLLE